MAAILQPPSMNEHIIKTSGDKTKAAANILLFAQVYHILYRNCPGAYMPDYSVCSGCVIIVFTEKCICLGMGDYRAVKNIAHLCAFLAANSKSWVAIIMVFPISVKVFIILPNSFKHGVKAFCRFVKQDYFRVFQQYLSKASFAAPPLRSKGCLESKPSSSVNETTSFISSDNSLSSFSTVF